MIGLSRLVIRLFGFFAICPTERELLSRHVGTHRHQRFIDAALASQGLARRVGQAHWAAPSDTRSRPSYRRLLA